MGIRENLQEVREKVAGAARRAGRDPGDIELVAVSKSVSIEKITEAYALGAKNFGENKAQEFLRKHSHLPADTRWHFIGHLQTNKVRKIIEKVHLIHSLDRVALAEEISRAAEENNLRAPVLIQVNIGGQGDRYGILPDQVSSFAAGAARLPGLEIKGLMAMAPWCEDPEAARPYFRKMASLFKQVKENVPGVSMEYFSMGMTGDYQVAVEEGANIIRVGTAIFGPR
ncbi:MAG: YggS family pyridoxal phosphate-dependent enzyme [Eubacteriales bacterium]